MNLVKISKSVYIPEEKILSICEYHSRNSTNILKRAKENNKWIDATNAKATKCLIILTNEYVITSAFSVDTIADRILHPDEKKRG